MQGLRQCLGVHRELLLLQGDGEEGLRLHEVREGVQVFHR